MRCSQWPKRRYLTLCWQVLQIRAATGVEFTTSVSDSSYHEVILFLLYSLYTEPQGRFWHHVHGNLEEQT